MDKRDGKLLQAFRDPAVRHTSSHRPSSPYSSTNIDQFENKNYRIRSIFAAADSLVISGGEDGSVFVWDLLSGSLKHKLRHTQPALTDGTNGSGHVVASTKKDVVSAVAWNQLRKEWATAGGDGTVVVWGSE